MIPNDANMAELFHGFSTVFNKALANSQSFYRDVAMVVPSSSGANNYGWLGAMPRMREWLGDRMVHQLSAHTYVIRNRTFENTVAIRREAIEDDQFGIYGPVMERMGQDAAQHPDEMVFGLLASGFAVKCFDGQNFFDTAHPVGLPGATVSVSNMQAGTGPAWFLLDCSQAIRPLLFQERMPYKLDQLTSPTSDRVFWNNEYVYGVRARCNAGLGVWQLAFGSKADLTPDNYAAARAAMMSQKSDTGRPLGIKPTHLVTVPALEGDALRLLRSTVIDATTNEWAGTATPVVTQFLLEPPPGGDGGSAAAV